MIIHDDPPVHRETSCGRDLRIGFDADRNDHHVCRDAAAVLEFDRLDLSVAEETSRRGFQQYINTFRLDSALEHRCRACVELALHQAIHQVNKRGLGAGLGEPVGRLDAEKSAANHDDARAAMRGPGNRSTSARSRKVSTPGRLRRQPASG